MGVADYLNKTKKSGFKKRDNIELLRPIVNIFVGEFQDDEKQILMDTLIERVGNSKKIHYCEIKLGSSEAAISEGIYQFHCSGTTCVNSHDIGSWSTISNQAAQSGQMTIDARDLVNLIFNEASEFVYESRGRVRLNYIIQADWIGVALLDTLVDVFSASFGEYYSNGVDTDLYCILDQQGHSNNEQGEERKALNYRALTAINRIVEARRLKPAYVLSNFTSLGCLEPESLKERIETIALHMIIKDGKSVGDRERRFSELNFVEAARANVGHFCTIGKLNLKVDEELRDWVVYKTMFAELYCSEISESTVNRLIGMMGVSKADFEAKVEELLPGRGVSEPMLYPMVMNRQVTPAEFLSASNETMIEKLYGQGLDYFWQENFKDSQEEKNAMADEIVKNINIALDSAYRNSECSLAEVYQTIERIEEQFREYVREYRNEYSDIIGGFETWKKERCNSQNVRETAKGTDVPRACYTLACQYLDKYTVTRQAEIFMEIAERCLQEIQVSASYYRKQSGTVREAMQELGKEIVERERNAEKLLGGNMDKYYTAVTREWMEDSDDYRRFFKTINNQICSRELTGEGIYREVIGFCDGKIIPDGRYSNDIAVEMLRRLKNYDNLTTEEEIYSLAFETIMKARKCFVNHTEFGRLYEAVCFLVNPDNDFVNSTNDQMNKLQRSQQLQWFFEGYYNGMDILFLEGCFAVNNIYQYDLYKRVDENFEEV